MTDHYYQQQQQQKAPWIQCYPPWPRHSLLRGQAGDVEGVGRVPVSLKHLEQLPLYGGVVGLGRGLVDGEADTTSVDEVVT